MYYNRHHSAVLVLPAPFEGVLLYIYIVGVMCAVFLPQPQRPYIGADGRVKHYRRIGAEIPEQPVEGTPFALHCMWY